MFSFIVGDQQFKPPLSPTPYCPLDTILVDPIAYIIIGINAFFTLTSHKESNKAESFIENKKKQVTKQHPNIAILNFTIL